MAKDSHEPVYQSFRTSSSSIDDFFAGPPAPLAGPAADGRIRVSSLRQIEGAGFQFVASNKLVRLSQKDFWQLGEDEDGPYIERLVSDAEGPVKG